MGRSAISQFAVIAALAIAAVTTPAQERQEKVQIEVVNGGRVYHPQNLGSGERCEKAKPAILSTARIFAAIPEYQEIKKRGLDSNSAEYLIFMKKASDRFKDAIEKTVRRGGYDLVAESGAVAVKGKPLPDITDEVIKNL